MKDGIWTTCLLLLIAGVVYAEDVPAFKRRVIQVPVSSQVWVQTFWRDINEDGLMDLWALVPRDRKAFIYLHSDSGLPSTPTQSIELSEGTAWLALHDVDRNDGDEMLISTTGGLFFYRQSNGVFEIKPQKLIEAGQAFIGEPRPRIARSAPRPG